MGGKGEKDIHVATAGVEITQRALHQLRCLLQAAERVPTSQAKANWRIVLLDLFDTPAQLPKVSTHRA